MPLQASKNIQYRTSKRDRGKYPEATGRRPARGGYFYTNEKHHCIIPSKVRERKKEREREREREREKGRSETESDAALNKVPPSLSLSLSLSLSPTPLLYDKNSNSGECPRERGSGPTDPLLGGPIRSSWFEFVYFILFVPFPPSTFDL